MGILERNRGDIMNLTLLQKALQPVNCPACSQGSLGAIMRCDQDPKECVAKAICSNCARHFHIQQESGESDSEVKAICELNGMQCSLVPA